VLDHETPSKLTGGMLVIALLTFAVGVGIALLEVVPRFRTSDAELRRVDNDRRITMLEADYRQKVAEIIAAKDKQIAQIEGEYKLREVRLRNEPQLAAYRGFSHPFFVSPMARETTLNRRIETLETELRDNIELSSRAPLSLTQRAQREKRLAEARSEQAYVRRLSAKSAETMVNYATAMMTVISGSDESKQTLPSPAVGVMGAGENVWFTNTIGPQMGRRQGGHKARMAEDEAKQRQSDADSAQRSRVPRP